MFQIIIILLVLAFLAGFIAFLGDRLGSYIGKKRLSLFGLRPKQTGRFIGIIAGILIMLSTLGVMSLIDRDLTRTIIQADAIRAENQQLTSDRAALQKEIEEGQIRLAKAQENFTLASTERDSALAQRDNLVTETKVLDDELTALKIQSIQADTQLSQILDNLTSAEAALVAANRERDLALVVTDSALLERDNALSDADEAQTKLQLARDELVVSRTELSSLEEELVSTQESLEASKIGINQAYIEANRYSQEVTKLKSQINDNLLANQQTLFRANLLREQAGALQKQKELLDQEKAALEASNAELQLTLDNLVMRELVLQSEVSELQARLSSSTEQAEASRAELEEVSQRALSYVKDETIYNALIDARTTEDAFGQFSDLVTGAKQVANNRGASGLNVSSEKVDSVIEEVLKTEGADVVTLSSLDYVVMGQSVNAGVNIAENSVVAEAGKLIATRQFMVEADSSAENLENEIALLAEEANKLLQDLGVVTKLSPIEQDVLSFVETLSDYEGSIVVGLVTKDDIYKVSESVLELLVLR